MYGAFRNSKELHACDGTVGVAGHSLGRLTVGAMLSLASCLLTFPAVGAPTSDEKPAMPMASSSAERSGGRIKLIEPQEMTTEKRARYEADPMMRTNLARLLSIAETMGPKLSEMNKAMATGIMVPPMDREIVALATLHLERGEYEIAQHDVVADRMGIPRAKVDAIAKEHFNDPIFTDREKALLAFTRQVVRSVRVDDAVFDAVAAFYDRRQIVETIFVIGNYMLLLRVSEVAQLPIDGVQGANFWKNLPATK